jgi:hypothetical protein
MTEVYPQQPINKTKPNHLGMTCVDPVVVAIQVRNLLRSCLYETGLVNI